MIPLQSKSKNLQVYLPSVDTNIPYLSVTTSCSSDNKTIYLMVTNKNLEQDIHTEIILKNFTTDGLARIYTLWSNQIDSTNEKPPHNKVRIHESEIIFDGNILKTSFKKHSLTAIEITGRYE